MRAWIPTVSSAGLQARISPHFGKAPFFVLVDSDEATAESGANLRPEGCAGRALAAQIVGLGADAVICRRMGAHSLAELANVGIPVFLTEEWTVAAAVNALESGRLPRLTAEETCAQTR